MVVFAEATEPKSACGLLEDSEVSLLQSRNPTIGIKIVVGFARAKRRATVIVYRIETTNYHYDVAA